MILTIALLTYAAAMIGANLLVVAFGPVVTPLNAFFLIGLDLAMRDLLHMRLKAWHMGAMIAATGLLTYALNPASDRIALASTASFMMAAVVDWVVFLLARGTWLRRSVASNAAGALVDSLAFPTMAFGSFMPGIVAVQYLAKTVGGAVWSMTLDVARSALSQEGGAA